MSKSKKKKEKAPKEKVVYYDDNSTVSDMSCLDRHGRKGGAPKQRSTFREKWKTYWHAVRRMLFPMFAVLAVLFLIYFLMMLITGNLF